MDNPKAAKDIIENPDVVYGFSPEKGGRLDDFVGMIDWVMQNKLHQLEHKE